MIIDIIAVYLLIGIVFTILMAMKHLFSGSLDVPLVGWAMCIVFWPYTLYLTICYKFGWMK